MDNTFEYDLRLGGERIRLRMNRELERTRSLWNGTSHNHAGYELHILLSGARLVDVAGRNHLLRENQAILIAPGQYHCPIPVTGEFERFTVSFVVEDGLLRRALEETVPVCRVYPVTAEVVSACRDVFFECGDAGIFERDLLQCHLLRVLVYNLRLLNLTASEIDPSKAQKKSNAAVKGDYNDLIDSYFETHLKTGAKAEELAAKLYVSRRQMNRLLQEHYGLNFREKLLRTRMDRAAWLLRHTDMAVCAVAEEVGYAAASSFYYVFRERFGMTPEQYRTARQKNEDTV